MRHRLSLQKGINQIDNIILFISFSFFSFSAFPPNLPPPFLVHCILQLGFSCRRGKLWSYCLSRQSDQIAIGSENKRIEIRMSGAIVPLDAMTG